MNNYALHESKIRENINPENFLRNAKQEYPCQSLESLSREYYNMENKILNFQFGRVCTNQTRLNYCLNLCAHKLGQITVLEANKMKQKSIVTKGIHQNGATMKNMKRYQPVKNACAVTKFRQLRHFISNLKQESPGLQLFWKF